MANIKKTKTTLTSKLIKCVCCGTEKTERYYYKSNADIYSAYEKLPICKECVGKIYDKYFNYYADIKTALYYMCRALNVCFSQSCVHSTLSELQNSKRTAGTPAWQIYFTKLNSIGAKHGVGDDFDSSDELEKMGITIQNTDGVDENLIEFWGENRSPEDYRFLDKEYHKMIRTYGEPDGYSTETFFMEIAEQRLTVDKLRRAGKSVDKELATLQNLFGSANMKPSQESATMASEQVTMGTLIKKYENEKPIPEPLEEWQKVNWVHYMLVWFLGNLCRMMGVKCPYEDEYLEEMDKYTVMKPTYDDEDFNDDEDIEIDDF